MAKSAMLAVPLSSEDRRYLEILRSTAFSHFRDKSSSFESTTEAIAIRVEHLPSVTRARLKAVALGAGRRRRFGDKISPGETLASIIAALGYWDFLLDLNAMNLSFLPNQDRLRASIKRKLGTDTGVDPALVESLSKMS